MNKKGQEILLSNTIFILLNIVFFVALVIFIVRAGSGAGFYEEEYSKKIALLIDQAKPGTRIELDVSEVIDKYGKDKEVLEMFRVDESKNKVIVRLKEGKGYEFRYFSDVDIELESESEIEENRNYLIIKVGGK